MVDSWGPIPDTWRRSLQIGAAMFQGRRGRDEHPASWAFFASAAALLWLASLTSAALAQADLRALVGRGGAAVALPSEGATGRVDFDFAARIDGPAGGAALSAPGDDAIIVVHQGGDVTLTDVAFRKAGSERFAAYVNGGTLRIKGCRVEGGFDTAFYVAAGRLDLSECVIAGGDGAPMVGNGIVAQPGTEVAVAGGRFEAAAEVMVYAAGATLGMRDTEIADAARNGVLLLEQARAEMERVRITGRSETMLVATQGAALTARGIRLEGGGGTALFAQGSGPLDLGAVDVGGAFEGGVILQDGAGARIDGFAITGAVHPVQVQGQREPVLMRNGRIRGAPDKASVVIPDSAEVALERVRIRGGDVGLVLSGRVGGLRLSGATISGQTRYGVALQDIAQAEGGAPPLIEDTTIIATGEALGLFAANAGPVGLRGATLLGRTAPTIYLDNAYLDAADNRVVTVPPRAQAGRRVALRDLDGDLGRRFLPAGPTDPVRGVVVPPDGIAAQGVAELVAADGLTRQEKFALADFALGGANPGTGAEPDPGLVEMALLATPPLRSLAERTGVAPRRAETSR